MRLIVGCLLFAFALATVPACEQKKPDAGAEQAKPGDKPAGEEKKEEAPAAPAGEEKKTE